MEEAKQVSETENNQDRNVIHLFDPPRPARQHEKPATDEELAEYRKNWPRMMKMLEEFEALKAATGCPIMREKFGLS